MRVLALVAVLSLAACASPATPAAAPSPAPPPSPSSLFADVTVGKQDTIVKLHAYDAKAASVVVEPTIFLQNPEFCETFHLPESDGRCQAGWGTEDSNTRVTLPLTAGAELLTVNAGDPECLDPDTAAATCAAKPAAFAALLGDNPEMLVRIRVSAGTVDRVAELYLP